jgi:hypothetical protein
MQFKPAARAQAAALTAGFLHPPLTGKLSDEAIENALEKVHSCLLIS